MPLRLICASHTPLMDHVPADPRVDSEVRAHLADLAVEVREFDPELIVMFGPDHFKGFFYDLLPPFTIGVRATAIGDYDIGGGDFRVPEELALGAVRSVHRDDVDVAMSYRMQADHGFAQLLVLLTGAVDRFEVIPVHINCAGPPLPSFRQVRRLGSALGRWTRSLDKRVLVIGSGGLSHDPPMPNLRQASPEVAEMLIAGRNPPIEARRAREQANFDAARKLAAGGGSRVALNPEWDRDFLRSVAAGDLSIFDSLGEDELAGIAGCGGHEVRTWVAAYAALQAWGPYASRELYYAEIPQWIAGFGIVAAEPFAAA
jgi:2,3-dihydroxyphenylpropionate 1,2-dioxygenase